LALSKIAFVPKANSDDDPYRWIQFCLNLLGDPAMTIPSFLYDIQGRITSPANDADVKGKVEIKGTAVGADFISYKLEYLDSEWKLIVESTTPVSSGTLGYWDTTNLPIGFYDVRLVVKAANNIEGVRSIKCFVDNTVYHPGWPVKLDGRMWSSPACADLDQDGETEIAVAAINAYENAVFLYLFNRDNLCWGSLFNCSKRGW